MAEKGNEDAELENATGSGDVGSIGNLTLLPTVFSTKSYGWKGSKRLTVELQDGDTDAEGGKEKVQITLTWVYTHAILSVSLAELTFISIHIASMPP